MLGAPRGGVSVHIYGHGPLRIFLMKKPINFLLPGAVLALVGQAHAPIAAIYEKHYYLRPCLPDEPPVSGHKGFLDHYHELIGTWTRKLRSRQQAEDLTHDAFVRVLENPREQVEQPRAYLHQTARNIAVDGYRREERRQALELAAFASGLDGGGDPQDYVHALELADRVERALAELPLNCRRVFIWQKLEGLTQAEIAERMGLTKNMVEKYMIRTLRHLREHLDVSAG